MRLLCLILGHDFRNVHKVDDGRFIETWIMRSDWCRRCGADR